MPLTGRDQVDIVFPNDNGSGGIDANLSVDWLQVNRVTYQKNSAIVDRGGGDGAFDGNDVLPGTNLYWSGALRFVVGNGGTAMGYDANGNMSYKLQHGQATVYEWNRENRFAAVKRNGTTLLFQTMTGRVLQTGDSNSLAPTDIFIDTGKLEIRFRPTSSSGPPVMEIVNHATKTFEKIHFNQ